MNQRKARRIRLETVFDDATEPVFLIDHRNKIRFINRSLSELTGWTVEQLIGQTSFFHSEPNSDKIESVTSALSPPPEVFEGMNVSYPVFLPKKSGQSLPFAIHFFSLKDKQNQTEFVLGILTEIQSETHGISTPPFLELHAELSALRSSLRHRYRLETIIGKTDDMLRVIKQARIASEQYSPLHLQGEPGTGKKHLARTIHYSGSTQSYAFVPFDCKKIRPWDLRNSLTRILDSYQHEREETNLAFVMNVPGTVLLENIEDLSRENQEWILKEFSAISENNKNSLRLITSSIKTLDGLRKESILLPDFYYFISVLEISLPSLSDRKEDLPVLAQHFLEIQNESEQLSYSGFHEDVLALFHEYNWPGNVSELYKVIEESASNCTGTKIDLESLPFRFHAGYESQGIGPVLKQEIRPLDELLKETEIKQIQLALEEAKQNKAEAARLLGITRPRLYRRMEQLGLL